MTAYQTTVSYTHLDVYKRQVEQLVRIVFFFNHQWNNAPGKVHLTEYSGIRGTADDWAVGTIFGNHTGGFTGFCHRHNGHCTQIMSGGAGSVGDRGSDVRQGLDLSLIHI